MDFNRYQSIQEPPVQLNLKFPIIEKKNMATLDMGNEKTPFLDELRNRMKLIDRRGKTDREDEVVVIEKIAEGKKEDGSSVEEIDRLAAQANKLQQGWKVREQLYGLLPSFRSPNQISDHKKKHKLHKNFKLKIEIAGDASIREVVSEYL